VRRVTVWALAGALLAASAALGWVAWERGEIELYLLLIVPVLKAEGGCGVAFLLLGLAALMALSLGLWTRGGEIPGPTEKASVGGVIMIGPLPIVLGSDRRAAILALVLAVVVLMAVVLLLLVQ